MGGNDQDVRRRCTEGLDLLRYSNRARSHIRLRWFEASYPDAPLRPHHSAGRLAAGL